MNPAAMPRHVQGNRTKMMVAGRDVAFAYGMIAHHQGELDKVQVLLTHGNTLRMRGWHRNHRRFDRRMHR